jgi:hypothetical protein
MPADPRLIERSATLKSDLVDFVGKPRYQRAFRLYLAEHYGDDPLDEGEFVNALDAFMLEHRFPDGRSVIDDFLKARSRLPQADREMLQGWKRSIETILHVQRIDGEVLVGENLIDEMTYRVHTNAGPGTLRAMPPGSFVLTRLTPLQDEWLMSGAASVTPKSDSLRARMLAREAQMARPDLVFRNPQKLSQGWELQRRDRDTFIGYFGSDTVVFPREQFGERYAGYLRHKLFEVRDEHGLTIAEQSERRYGQLPELPDTSYIDAGIDPDAETIGVIYDEVDGFNLYADFALFEETFANPKLADNNRHRRIVHEYLKGDEITPLPFRRMAQHYPEGIDQAFQTLLRRPAFTWERDGEQLMRRHKPRYFETEPQPSLIPVSDPFRESAGGLLATIRDILGGGEAR